MDSIQHKKEKEYIDYMEKAKDEWLNDYLKISVPNNEILLATDNTGIGGVTKTENPLRGSWFIYLYRYYPGGTERVKISDNLIELKNKVIRNNLPWSIVDEEKFIKTCKDQGINPIELRGD